MHYGRSLRPAQPGNAVNVDPALGRQYATLYGPVSGERFPIPAVRLSDINSEYLRTAVFYPTHEQPGTIVIDPQNHFLYLIKVAGVRSALVSE
jgi:lipoprotein-anchoring transpeptidase ErfK/SrfK